jgi:hypothetical protein
MALLMLRDWSVYPGFISADEDKSGEAYYEQILREAFIGCLSNKEVLEINLDGVRTIPSIFMKESFLRLSHVFGPENVVAHLRVISNERSDWPRQINKVINGVYGAYKERA